MYGKTTTVSDVWKDEKLGPTQSRVPSFVPAQILLIAIGD